VGKPPNEIIKMPYVGVIRSNAIREDLARADPLEDAKDEERLPVNRESS
jgi:hypothetical protein